MFNFPKLCCSFYELPPTPPFLYLSHICPLVVPPHIVLEEGVTFRQGEENRLTTNIETGANKSPDNGRKKGISKDCSIRVQPKAVKNNKDVYVAASKYVYLDCKLIYFVLFFRKLCRERNLELVLSPVNFWIHVFVGLISFLPKEC